MVSPSSSSTTLAQYSSAVNMPNFVSRKLYFGVSSDNYTTWKKQMLCLLESNNLVGFIGGEEAPPPAPEKGKMKSEDYVAWRMSDSLVKGWILGALSDELVEFCVEFLSQEKEKDTARTVWLELEKKDPSQRQPPTRPPNQGLRKWYKVLVPKLQKSLLVVIDCLVPHGRRTHKKKLMHQQAIQLVKCLCMNMTSLTEAEATHIYSSPMLTAARLGIHEIIEEIVETFPDAVYNTRSGHYFFQIAAKFKNEKVFNLIYQTGDHRHIYSDLRDSSENTILHLVAALSPQHKLNFVSGAALQMQRELQWFKQVEEFVHPYARKLENDDGKTPHMIFTEEHKSLKAEGEKWMKDTAQSYIIVAALIATVSFAAAITAPGGNNSNTGYPMFYRSNAFIVFAISVAATLFTSFTSLWMFLSIMTSRYAEEDFLYALPRGLCIGISTLSISNFFMMVAFSASSYLVLGKEQKWVLLPVVVLACLPITAFVLLQFPLLIAVLSSTYGRGIFDKGTDHSPYY